MKKLLFFVLMTLSVVGTAEAQLGKFGDKLKRGINAATDAKERAEQQKEQLAAAKLQENSTASFAEFTAQNIPDGALFVCQERGSARGAGTKEAPVRDIQKAIDLAPDGGTVCVAEGNYLGTLDRGWIEVKGKYVTRMQPSVDQRGSIGMGMLMLDCIARRSASMVIDGIFFDLGNYLEYCKADPTDERFGCPEGCETGRVLPISSPPNSAVRFIGGKWLFVPAKRFDEVELLKEYENNKELPGTSTFKDLIDPHYLKGFANLKIMTTSSFDPNSAANLYRAAHGMNMQGTSTTRVSMYGIWCPES